MPEELLERVESPEVPLAPDGGRRRGFRPRLPRASTPSLFEHDERAARADLRRQIAAMEAELGQLFASAFPRTGIEFRVPAPGGGPRVLAVDELERVRDALAARISARSGPASTSTGCAEEASRELIERDGRRPASHKWVRVSNEHIGEPGCRHWHSRPRWGLLGMLIGWWRVKVSSGCPLAMGLARPVPPRSTRDTEPAGLMAKKRSRKRRKERRQGIAPPRLPRTPERRPPGQRSRRAPRSSPSGAPAPPAGPAGDDGPPAAPVGIVPAV